MIKSALIKTRLRIVILLIVSIALTPAHTWAALTQTQVSQLYVSIFGRASEGEGNAFWQSNQPDMMTAANQMLATAAAQNYFGSNLDSDQTFIEHIFLNTLNKTLTDDSAGIAYWVGKLSQGKSRGEVAATLVAAIQNYAPNGPGWNDPDIDIPTTTAAYNQFINRVEVSNYMADMVYNTPFDWETSTSFKSGLIVTDETTTVVTAKASLGSDQDIATNGGDLESKFGIWEGEGQQVGYSWTIKITLAKGEYLIEYPSLECKGELTLLEDKGSQLLFRETITQGAVTETQSGCCDRGFVELIDQGTNSLIYRWYSPDASDNKGELDATGTVTKTQQP